MIVIMALAALCFGGVALVGAASGRWPSGRAGFALGVVALVVSWYGLFVWLAGMTEAFLVPWDLTPARPPVGTWPRAVNDFFEVPPGSLLLGGAVVVSSAAMFVARLPRTSDRRWLPWLFAAANLAFIPANLVLVVLLTLPLDLLLPSRQYAHELGYSRTGPLLALTLLLSAALLIAQARLPDVASVGRRLT